MDKKILIICPVISEPEPDCLAAIHAQDHANVEVLIHRREPTQQDPDPTRNTILNIVANRNAAREKALATDADAFLWVDGDVVIPPHTASTFSRLDLPLAAGWYPMIGVHPTKWVAATMIDAKGTMQFFNIVKPGLTQVDETGFGCFYCRRDMLERISFRDGLDRMFQDTDGRVCYFSEDGSFVQDAQKLGIQTYMVGDIICRHIDMKTTFEIDGIRKLLRDCSAAEIKSVIYDIEQTIARAHRDRESVQRILIERQNQPIPQYHV